MIDSSHFNHCGFQVDYRLFVAFHFSFKSVIQEILIFVFLSQDDIFMDELVKRCPQLLHSFEQLLVFLLNISWSMARKIPLFELLSIFGKLEPAFC